MLLAVLATIQTGGYINPFKAVGIIVLLLVWARLLTWIDKDAPAAHLPREVINSAMFGALVLGYALFFFLPGFGLAFSVLMLAFLAGIGGYLGVRAKVVGLKDLKTELANWWSGMFSKGEKKVKAVAGQVMVMDKSGAAQPVPDAESEDRMPYDAAQQLLTRPMRNGAQQVDLTSGDPPSIAFLVDGMKYDGEVMDRNGAGAAVQYLKRVANLDLSERRKPQTGTFRTQLNSDRRIVQITTFGSAAGESLRLMVDPQNRFAIKVENLGFSDEQMKVIREAITEPGGVVLLAAPKAQGLTSLAYSIIRAHDAFLFHVHTIERAPEMDLEGITQNELPANASPADEAKQVSWVASQEPDVIMVTSLEDSGSAVDLAKFASEKKRVYVCLRAGSTFEAMRQWRKLVGDDALAMRQLRLVVAGRLVRRLCSACKVGYTPDPAHLRKLNMNPEEVGMLYQARKEPMRDAKGNPVPCAFCHDLAFKGRLGVYELFSIDDDVRKAVISGGTENQLKQLMRKQQGRLLLEVALAQVRAGETSIEEVLRVLKPEVSASSAAPTARPPAKAPAAAKSPSAPRANPAAKPS